MFNHRPRPRSTPTSLHASMLDCYLGPPLGNGELLQWKFCVVSIRCCHLSAYFLIAELTSQQHCIIILLNLRRWNWIQHTDKEETLWTEGAVLWVNVGLYFCLYTIHINDIGLMWNTFLSQMKVFLQTRQQYLRSECKKFCFPECTTYQTK